MCKLWLGVANRVHSPMADGPARAILTSEVAVARAGSCSATFDPVAVEACRRRATQAKSARCALKPCATKRCASRRMGSGG